MTFLKRVSKPMVALVAALGLVTFLAAPSAASSGAITGGTLIVDSQIPPLSTTFGGTGGCAPATITTLDSSTGALGSTSVTGTIAFALTQGSFAYAGNNYVFAVTSSGTYTSTHTTGGAYALSVHMNLTGGTIRDASATDPCSSTGTTRCGPIVALSFNLTGTATLTAVHPGPVGTVHLGGDRTITAFGCSAPFSALNGKKATLSSVTATLT